MNTPPPPFEIAGEAFLQVFLHKSLGTGRNNQRLAALGHCVLDLVVTNHLYHQTDVVLQEFAEKRTKLLDVANIKKWNAHYNLTLNLNYDKSIEQLSDGDEEELFCAYIGAAYVQYGPEKTNLWLFSLMFPNATQPSVQRTVASVRAPPTAAQDNILSRFNEMCQKRGFLVEYTAQSEGPGHLLRWTVDCMVQGVLKGRGEGGSKQLAKEAAARTAWDGLNFGVGA